MPNVKQSKPACRGTTLVVARARRPSNGVVGWGEAFGSSGSTIPAAFDNWIRASRHRAGCNDADLSARIERQLHGLGRSGPVIHALSALDIALWDIRGKLEGVPVSTLLGGARRKRVEAYASCCITDLSSTCAGTSRARLNAATGTSSCMSGPPTQSRGRARWPELISRSWWTPTAPGRRRRRPSRFPP